MDVAPCGLTLHRLLGIQITQVKVNHAVNFCFVSNPIVCSLMMDVLERFLSYNPPETSAQLSTKNDPLKVMSKVGCGFT